MKLKIILEQTDEGEYTVNVPSLPGCISEGDTKEYDIKKYLVGGNMKPDTRLKC